jgi:predicted permease
LIRDRGLSAAAVVTLVVGMSATITMFTIVHGVYFRDLPFQDPDRIVTVALRYLTGAPGSTDQLSWLDLRDLQSSATMFDGVFAADEDSMDLADDAHAPERVVGAFVSANAFALLGHRPIRGRDFTAADDRDGVARVVILGYDVWRRRYGGDEAIVGRLVRVNGTEATVIGVMPERFGFPVRSQVWLPLAAMANPNREDRGRRNIESFGRLARGATLAQAEADMGRVMAKAARDAPKTYGNIAPLVRPFRELTTSGPIRVVFAGLMGSAVLLLLVACANVANLLLAHGVSRAREIAVRVSLGATRRQVVRQLLTESLVLAALATAAGLLVAAGGVRLLEMSFRGTGEPYWLRFPIDVRIFGFAAIACVITTMLCGLAPALHTSQVRLSALLSEGGRGSSLRTGRWTDGFVVMQIALSFTMLAAAGLMMRNVTVFSQVNPGVDATYFVTAQMNVSQRYPTVDERRTFYRRLRERLAALPDMRAGIGFAAPMKGAIPTSFAMQNDPPDVLRPSVSMVSILPGYLEALGVRPVRGRLFTERDVEDEGGSVIVNQWFVDAHLGGQDPLGQSIRVPSAPGGPLGDRLTIVGVVPNIRHRSPRQQDADPTRPDPAFYLPFSGDSPTIVVYAPAGAGAVAVALREAVGAIDPNLPILSVLPMGESLAQEMTTVRVFSRIFAVFALVALGLAAVGLCGITAYAVSQRTREVGVRRALGARDRHVWWLVTRRAAAQLAVGLILGVGGALAAGQLLQGVLTGVGSRDPVTLIVVPSMMAGVAMVACVVPARRALRLDPADLLRVE